MHDSNSLHCPKCDHELASHTLHGIPVESCPACNGIWFHREKIRAFLGQALASSGQPAALATLRDVDPVPTELTCPVCREKWLKSIKPHGVEIEKCSGCGGVFLDPGEIDLLSLQTISDALDRQATCRTPIRPVWGGDDPALPFPAGETAVGLVEMILEVLSSGFKG